MKVFHGETEIQIGDTYEIRDIVGTRRYKFLGVIDVEKERVELFSFNSDRVLAAYAGAFDLRILTDDGQPLNAEGGEE